MFPDACLVECDLQPKAWLFAGTEENVMSGKREISKKPSSETANKSPSGKKKATPKPKGGGVKQGERR
jgi:hypothetical protein